MSGSSLTPAQELILYSTGMETSFSGLRFCRDTYSSNNDFNSKLHSFGLISFDQMPPSNPQDNAISLKLDKELN
ncbi:unnamed protein product [Ceratitis capitata]|uniref:(Mediterranean fruit fly) hypothetical protein n=1 Tax=Ceratitis capitata TaxID=7213 RepID=A0A811UWS8_CERCA|nr:unnamed protein product [Ceratitis capitata]